MKSLEDAFREMTDSLDGHNWYWLSYGEKCYAFATVTAFPLNDDCSSPPSGGRLDPHPEKDRAWIAEDGTEMLVDEEIAAIEDQHGDVVCRFLAAAYAYCQQRSGGDAGV
jgi:hypothetical protein